MVTVFLPTGYPIVNPPALGQVGSVGRVTYVGGGQNNGKTKTNVIFDEKRQKSTFAAPGGRKAIVGVPERAKLTSRFNVPNSTRTFLRALR